MPRQQQVSMWLILIFICFITMATPLWHSGTACQAQIITDGSLGPGRPIPGPDFQIPAEMGQIRGGNLFHSFEQFNIYSDESATFTGPNSISNILSRVTGGDPSNIFGPIRSDIPGVNLFLLNPNGVLFGPGARVDIGGSFHVSTADRVTLQDQGVFHSHVAQTSTLTTAEPAAFGFLSPNPAAIRLEGARLAVSAGESVSIVAGGITLSPTSARQVDNGAIAPGGQVQLLSVSSPGDIAWTAAGELVPEDAAMLGGEITVEAGGRVSVAGAPGGRIRLRGGEIRIDEGIIDAQVEGDAATGSIRLDGANIRVDNLSQLTGGEVNLTARDIKVDNGSRLEGESLVLSARDDIEITGNRRVDGREVRSQLNGRNISITADDLVEITDRADVNGMTDSAADAGSIMVQARELTLDSGARVRTNATRGSSGNAGVITIQANVVTIDDDSRLSSTTRGSGRGGEIVIRAQAFRLDDESRLQVSALEDSTGDAGQITIEAERVTVTDNGSIQSVTRSEGNAGEISITAHRVEVTDTGSLQVDAERDSSGAAGRIHVMAEELIADQARIDSSARGPGDAGMILLESDEVTLRNDTRIFANARDADTGSGGEVMIAAKRVSLSDDSRIDNSTEGTGDAGTVTVMADQIDITDNSRILANVTSDGRGNGGRITLEAETVTVMDNSRVESDTRGQGHAGDVMVHARQVTVSDESRVSARARDGSMGNAGQVRIEASESVLVSGLNSQVLSRSTGQGDGGQVTFITPLLTVADEARISALGPDTSQFGAVDLSRVSKLVLDGGFVDGLHEIVLDGSLGISGPLVENDALQIVIPSEVGEHRGANLFHSFERFRLASGGTAIFTAPDTLTINTIIGRITGNDPALIDGVLRSDIPGAALFLLSPQGVVLGRDARLDIDGAFHLSTADYLRFDDETRFHSDVATTEGLSDGAPMAFGFAEAAAGWIRLQSAELSVGAGMPLSLVGGEIEMSGGRLSSAGGRVQVVSVDAATEVELTGSGEIEPEGVAATGGRISLSEDAVVTVEDRDNRSGQAGRVLLRGGEVSLWDATVKADAVLDGSAGVIAIEAGDLDIRDDSRLTAGVKSNSGSDGGRITLVADTIVVSGDSHVNAVTNSTGRAGDIVVQARELTVADESRLQASALQGSQGHAGNVTITSDTVTVTGKARIRSTTQGVGNGGIITINAKQIDVENAGRVQTSALEGSTGDGGQIVIDASERLTVSGGELGGGIIESFTEGSGDAGILDVYSAEIRIESGGRISAEVRENKSGPSGNGKSVTIEADRLLIEGRNSRIESTTKDSGHAGTITITAREIDLRDGALINTRTESSGNAGQIVIISDRIELRDNDARISSTSSGSGNAGVILIEANRIELKNSARIASVAERDGNAGRITLCTVCQGQSGQIELSRNARIEVSTRRSGAGGQVRIDTGTLTMTRNSEIEGQSRGAGRAGQVFIHAEEMHLADSQIEVNNKSTGAGGLIHVRAINLEMSDTARIDSNTEGDARAGDVIVSAREITMSGDSRFQASAFLESTGDAGTVTVTANRLTVQDMARIRSVTQGEGDAGTIRIIVDDLTVANKGRIQTSTQERDSGKAGNIMIDAKTITVSQVALIESFTLGDNNAGNINIRAEQMTVETGAQIRADTRADSTGHGGSVIVNADTLTVRNGGRINTETQGQGTAGNVMIGVNHLNLTEAGQISSLSLEDAVGDAGSVTIRGRELGAVANEIHVSRDGRIRTSVAGQGSGENAAVNIHANRLALSGFSIITATAEIENAGQITIDGLETLDVTESSITTDAKAGDGGNIVIATSDTLHLRDSAITATVDGGSETTGGNVAIDARLVTQQRSQILAQANQGKGGRIAIRADLVVTDFNSDISASSGIPANDGEVNVQGLVSDLSGSLVPLPKRFGASETLSRQRCAERVRSRSFSQFLYTSRDRMPSGPAGVLPSPSGQTAGLPMPEPYAARHLLPGLEAGLAVLSPPIHPPHDCR